MSNADYDPTGGAIDLTLRATKAAKAIYDAYVAAGGDPNKANEAAAKKMAEIMGNSTEVKALIDIFILLLDPLLTAFYSVLSGVRHGVNASMGPATAEILNDILGTSFDADVLTPPGGGNGTTAKANLIGKAVLGSLETMLSSAHIGTEAPGGAAAQTFAGFGINLALQNAVIGIIGGLVPEVHFDDAAEIGDDIERALGLGRLTRTALHPLVNTLIAEPYRQELNTKYSPNILGEGLLAQAWLSSRLVQDDVMDLLRKQGLPDTQIKELIEQHRLRLKDTEWNTLTALGKQGDDPAAYDDAARGMDSDWLMLRQTVLTWQRLAPLRDRVFSEILKQISQGFLPSSALQAALQRYNLPQDEQQVWLDAAQSFHEVPRKRIGEAQMLFLYEAAQVTDLEVEEWLNDEGYSPVDVQRLLTYFRLQLIAKTQGVAPRNAAHLAALHLEHTAYVTDEITGLWGRAPNKAELDYWVALLDTGARTKHDFVTELKGLPTTGPAMP